MCARASAARTARTCTSQSAAKALLIRLTELHPYDEPALIGLPVDADSSAPGFLAWVANEVGAQ